MPPPTSRKPRATHLFPWLVKFAKRVERRPTLTSRSVCSNPSTWIWVEIEDCTWKTKSLEAASVWGVLSFLFFFKRPLFPTDEWTGNNFSFHRGQSTALHFHLCTQSSHLPIPVFSLPITYQSSYPLFIFTLKKHRTVYKYMITPDQIFFFFFLLWMFLCCTPSYSVVYWLLSCGMFVLSQSNVVFTLKPHFS